MKLPPADKNEDFNSDEETKIRQMNSDEPRLSPKLESNLNLHK